MQCCICKNEISLGEGAVSVHGAICCYQCWGEEKRSGSIIVDDAIYRFVSDDAIGDIDMFGNLIKKYDELAGNTSDSLPDYAVPPSTHHLFDQYTSIPKTRNPKEAFYQGALSVLRLLGQNETATREEVEKLARDMTHEARHFLSHMNKE
jgi:hypothetical protein